MVYRLLILLIVFLSVLSVRGGRSKSVHELLEKLADEKEDVSYLLTVVTEEERTAVKRIVALKMGMAKLRVLWKSNRWLQLQCPPMKSQCAKGYGETSLYLRKEMEELAADLAEANKSLQNIQRDKNELQERLVRLNEGLPAVAGLAQAPFRVTIPELRATMSCKKQSGWNPYRGVFIPVKGSFSLPVDGVVDSIVSVGNKRMLIVDSGEAFLLFAYIGTILVKDGEQVPAGTPLFSGASGNPLNRTTVLFSIVKNKQFVYPLFVCK